MKKIFIITLILFLCNIANSQSILIHKTTGSIITILLAQLDSISFVNQIMKLNKTDGTFEFYVISDIQKITFNGLSTGNSEVVKKVAIILNQLKGFPNPGCNQFTLEYTLTEKTSVLIKIYTIKGELVKQVSKESMNAGDYTFEWDTKDNAGKEVINGTYLCHIITNNKLLTNKLIVVKN